MTLCHAHSTRTGLLCKQHAVKGASVCVTHGARAPQVQEAARRRLLELVAPAIAELAKLVRQADTDGTKLRAIETVLDRSGLKVADLVKVDNEVRITVSYEDRDMAPPPGRSTVTRNGHALGDGQQSV